MSIDHSNAEVFPYISFEGRTAREIGHEHGSLLVKRIDEALRIYREQFSKQTNFSEKFILNLCEEYHRGISFYSNDHLDELNAIAVASKQDPRWIVALNARLEILNHLNFGKLNECTVLYDRSHCRLAENWDWIEDFERLVFINHIKSKGILQMTEPGVLAKIGFNQWGVGVTMNFIDPPFQPANPSNIPLHISLRSVLERAHHVDEAVEIFKKNGPGFGGHVLVGDDQSRCCCVEFPGDQVRLIDDHPYHTNHFLSITEQRHIRDQGRYQSSYDRYERVKQLWNENSALEAILSDYDDEHQQYPICRSFKPSFIGSVGTVCSIIMNLKERNMLITKGNPRNHPDYHRYSLEKNEV